MTTNHVVFLTVPLFAFLCNLFLFFAIATVKKNKLLLSFMGLLGAFSAMTLGSFLLRIEFFPGAAFWHKVSQAGVFFVPYCYYAIALNYLGLEYRRQRQLRFALTLVAVALVFATDIFSAAPVVYKGEGRWYVEHGFYWPLLCLAALALGLLAPSIVRLYKEGRADVSKRSGFFAVSSGVLLFAVGISSYSLGLLNGFPFDTLAATINAFIIYYALYKRHVNRLSRGASAGVLYFLWGFLTLVLVAVLYDGAGKLFDRYLAAFSAYREVTLTLVFSLVALCVFVLLNRIYGLLFKKEQAIRSAKLKEFSLAASKTLDRGDLVNALADFFCTMLPSVRAYVFMPSAEDGRYTCAGRSAGLDRRMEFNADSPFFEWLKDQNDVIRFSEFRQTPYHGMISENERQILAEFDTELLLPLNADGRLTGFVLLSKKADRKKFTSDETNLLASVLPVFSVALNNATLYEKIALEAQRDPLTGLYNRRFFTEKLESDCSCANGSELSVLLFNLDDFHLYNEMYGNDEGDSMLVQFSKILKTCLKSGATVARYASNEFAALLPASDAADAEKYAQKVKSKLAEHLGVSSDPTMFLAFSAGICAYPSAASSPQQLMSFAAFAVRRAKSDGKNRIVTYAPEMSSGGAGEKDRATIIQEYASTIYALTAAIDTKDHYTFNHSLSVSHYAASLAEAAGMGVEMVEAVRQAGLLHDIGKLAIPDEILTKAGKLTDTEVFAMRKHVERSVEMIRHLPSLSYVTPLVLGHHERYDGRGYPRAIAGDSIPIGARCLTIADSFDAMISRRTYKKPMPIENALDEIRLNLGKQFDPSLGRLFISMVEAGELNVACY